MITYLVWICVIPPSLALFYFAVEVIAGLHRNHPAPVHAKPIDLTVIIPAHNEALLIAETVSAARRCIDPATKILVIADNCSDATAELARSSGATVVERTDPSRRGKGFALAFARDYLSRTPPDAVFVLDADCRISRGSVEAMATHAVCLGEPVQSSNLLSASADCSPLILLSNFAMLIKNLVRARGLYRIGGGITLFGTGMAFPWNVFVKVDLATSESVEDLAIALTLAMNGTKVHLYEQLLVTSAAAELGDSLSQRKRWEHGFLDNAFRKAFPLLVMGVMRRSRHLLAIGVHLLIPPLALLLLTAAAASIPAVALAVADGDVRPGFLLLCALLCAAASIAGAWQLEARATLSLRVLARAPVYVLWKIPLYAGFIGGRQKEWNRTRRANEKN